MLGAWLLPPNSAAVNSWPTLQLPFLADVTVLILLSVSPMKHERPRQR